MPRFNIYLTNNLFTIRIKDSCQYYLPEWNINKIICHIEISYFRKIKRNYTAFHGFNIKPTSIAG